MYGSSNSNQPVLYPGKKFELQHSLNQNVVKFEYELE